MRALLPVRPLNSRTIPAGRSGITGVCPLSALRPVIVHATSRRTVLVSGREALEPASAPGPRRVAAIATASTVVPASTVKPLVTRVKGIPARPICGRYDTFAGPSRRLLAVCGGRPDARSGAVPEMNGHSGCHDSAFRRRALPAQIPFLVRHLI